MQVEAKQIDQCDIKNNTWFWLVPCFEEAPSPRKLCSKGAISSNINIILWQGWLCGGTFPPILSTTATTVPCSSISLMLATSWFRLFRVCWVCCCCRLWCHVHSLTYATRRMGEVPAAPSPAPPSSPRVLRVAAVGAVSRLAMRITYWLVLCRSIEQKE